jgi:hypothetical protein
VKGTVNISLLDFKKLEASAEEAEKYKGMLIQLDKALTRLLVHASTVTDMNLISSGFNRSGNEQITKTAQGWRMSAK